MILKVHNNSIPIIKIEGADQLGDLFRFNITLNQVSNLKIGDKAQVIINDDSSLTGMIKEISEFFDYQVYMIQLVFVPCVATLGYVGKNRVWEEKTALEVIEEVLKEHGLSVRKKISAHFEKENYIVQYQQSDLEFCAFELAKLGLNWIFEEEQIVIFDDIAHLNRNFNHQLLVANDITNPFEVSHYQSQSQTIIEGFHGFLYNFTQLKRQEFKSENKDGGMFFPYPTHITQPFFKALTNHQQTNQHIITFTTTQFMHVGTKFKLIVGKSKNDSVEKEYYVLNAQYTLHQQIESTAQVFKVIIKAVQVQQFKCILPSNLKPAFVSGVQLGLVIEKVDSYGRVRVRMMWDEKFIHNKEDQKNACWIRVSQQGTINSGHFYVPQIGDEVIVMYEGGDISKPLIIGTLLNNANLADHDPTKEHISYWKVSKQTNSESNSKESEKEPTLNKITLSGQERSLVQIDACNDMNFNIENDFKTHVNKGIRSFTIEEGDDKKQINKGNMEALLKEGNAIYQLEKGDHQMHLKEGNCTLDLDNGDISVKIKGELSKNVNKKAVYEFGDQVNIKAKKRTCVIEKGAQLTIDSGNYVIKINGGKLDISAKEILTSANKITIKANTDLTLEGLNVNIKGKKGITLDAPSVNCKAQLLALKGNASASLEGGAMTQIKGGIVKIN